MLGSDTWLGSDTGQDLLAGLLSELRCRKLLAHHRKAEEKGCCYFEDLPNEIISMWKVMQLEQKHQEWALESSGLFPSLPRAPDGWPWGRGRMENLSSVYVFLSFGPQMFLEVGIKDLECCCLKVRALVRDSPPAPPTSSHYFRSLKTSQFSNPGRKPQVTHLLWVDASKMNPGQPSLLFMGHKWRNATKCGAVSSTTEGRDPWDHGATVILQGCGSQPRIWRKPFWSRCHVRMCILKAALPLNLAQLCSKPCLYCILSADSHIPQNSDPAKCWFSPFFLRMLSEFLENSHFLTN